jgi:hypothetical protein
MSRWTYAWLLTEVTLAAVLFGLWQDSWLAGLFMLMVLLLQVDLAKVMR